MLLIKPRLTEENKLSRILVYVVDRLQLNHPYQRHISRETFGHDPQIWLVLFII